MRLYDFGIAMIIVMGVLFALLTASDAGYNALPNQYHKKGL